MLPSVSVLPAATPRRTFHAQVAAAGGGGRCHATAVVLGWVGLWQVLEYARETEQGLGWVGLCQGKHMSRGDQQQQQQQQQQRIITDSAAGMQQAAQ